MRPTTTFCLGTSSAADEYNEFTNINSYVVPNEPALYDPVIRNATLTHKGKHCMEEWDLIRMLWFIQKGFLRGIVDNLRDAPKSVRSQRLTVPRLSADKNNNKDRLRLRLGLESMVK